MFDSLVYGRCFVVLNDDVGCYESEHDKNQ